MNRERPVNLNLFTIRFPITAIVSILHRVSGVLLFLMIPIALWTLDYSLTPDGFDAIHDWSGGLLSMLVLWAVFAAFLYHFVAGIRHLLSDMGFAVTKSGGKRSALITFIISIVLIIMAGVWLW